MAKERSTIVVVDWCGLFNLVSPYKHDIESKHGVYLYSLFTKVLLNRKTPPNKGVRYRVFARESARGSWRIEERERYKPGVDRCRYNAYYGDEYLSIICNTLVRRLGLEPGKRYVVRMEKIK